MRVDRPEGKVRAVRLVARTGWSLALLGLVWWSTGGAASDRAPATTGLAKSTAVALELVLAVDASTSVSDQEFILQRGGLSAAFRDRGVCDAIERAGPDGVAVALVQWSNTNDQVLAVPWTHLRGAADCQLMAERIAGMKRSLVGGTVMSGALHFARTQIERNRFMGRRKVIDISADGPDRHGVAPAQARDRAVAAGITVNALAIMTGRYRLDDYLKNNIAGGPGAFVMTASGFEDFPAAIRLKLIREISDPSMAEWRPARLKSCRAPAPPKGRQYLTVTGTCYAAP